MAGGAWKRMGRVNGSDAGRRAKPVWLCAWCLCWHNDRNAVGKLIKPLACKFCGRDQFDYFMSSSEAGTWGALHLREKAGEVRNIRRQISYDLMTIGPAGLPRKWAEYVADFVFEEKSGEGWATIVADHKPVAGMAPDAALKLRCLEAQGVPVRVITTKGEV